LSTTQPQPQVSVLLDAIGTLEQPPSKFIAKSRLQLKRYAPKAPSALPDIAARLRSYSAIGHAPEPGKSDIHRRAAVEDRLQVASHRALVGAHACRLRGEQCIRGDVQVLAVGIEV
jgi:hypothetical protein